MFSFLSLITLTACCDRPGSQCGEGGGQDVITIDMPFINGYGSRCVQGTGGSYSHRYTSTKYDVDLDTPNDIDVPVYAPVSGMLAVHDGEPDRGFGVHANIDVGDGSYVILGHLSAVFVESGSEVAAGQLIGFEGTTGYSTGDHVHIGRHDGDAFEDGTYGTSIEGLAFRTAAGDVGIGDMTCSITSGDTYTSTLGTPLWHPNNTLVKTPGDAMVYRLEEGSKRAFWTEEAFTTRGYDFRDVVLIDDAELDCYDVGFNITGRDVQERGTYDDGALVSETGSSAVYVIADSIAMPIESWDVFLLMGFGGRTVTEVADGEIARNVEAVGNCGTNTYCITRADVTTCGGPDPEEEATFPASLVVTWTTPDGLPAERITLAGEYTHHGGTTETWRTLAENGGDASLVYTLVAPASGDRLRFSAEYVQQGRTSWSCLAPYPPGTVQGSVQAALDGVAVPVAATDDPSSDGCGLVLTVP